MKKGILVRWQEDKGFGFIKPDNATKDVFIHISVLKHMARKPRVGDVIEFETQQQDDGKLKAINAHIEGVAVLSTLVTTSRRSSMSNSRHDANKDKSSSSLLIPLFVILGLGVFGFTRYEAINEEVNVEPVPASEARQQTQWLPARQSYQCEAGKTHCSHMRSCEEATFYINNCPNTKMDGDNDGTPCERQLCSY